MTRSNSIFFYAFVLLLMVVQTSCKTNSEEAKVAPEVAVVQEYKPNAKDIENIEYVEYALSDAAENATKDWVKFQELLIQIEALKKADLSFFKDDRAILQAFITDLKNEIPDALNESSILVRLVALETILYKFEGTANLYDVKKEALLSGIGEVLVGHTNLVFQINKMLEKEAQNIQKPN